MLLLTIWAALVVGCQGQVTMVTSPDSIVAFSNKNKKVKVYFK
jgi:hypothetical protein